MPVSHTPPPSQAVVNTVAAHRVAMLADEAMFNDAGEPIQSAAAEVTLAAEIDAFRRFVEYHCPTAEDVQYKIDYLLSGDVGERDRMVDRIAWGEEDGVNLSVLLRSLCTAPAGQTTLTTSATPVASALSSVAHVVSFVENQQKLAQAEATGGPYDAA